MTSAQKGRLAFGFMALALIAVGLLQSWSVSLAIVNLCLISAIMALGLNIQWGYAGLFNAGVMGFAALGGVACILVAQAPVPEAWAAGGGDIGLSALMLALTLAAVFGLRRSLPNGRMRAWATAATVLVGYVLMRLFYDPGVDAIESVDSARTGYLGGLGLPIVFAWIVGGLIAAGVGWLVGKISLGLRSDYLAIATLGIAEIIIAIIKNEDWLTRGVKNVTGLPRPVPYEIELQTAPWFLELCESLGANPIDASSAFVKICYILLFVLVLALLLWLSERALNSPWGRMMRAIRDNEHAAEAMGKDVTRRHLQAFVLGCGVIGIAGAMLTTLDGQFTPTSYTPLRYTFIIWVMVMIGGSGNNWGAVLGGFLIWFLWVEAEPAGLWVMDTLTTALGEDSPVRRQLMDAAPHMRLFLMGVILLTVLRFAPQGLLPEPERR